MTFDTFKDVLPHWSVDGVAYYNQFKAWMAVGSGDTDRIQFHLYDKAFDSLDWTVEPTQPWDKLVEQRCQQIRNKYQHLCLLYSAGRDSHHILRSFAANKIPLDEIIIVDFTLNLLKHKEVDPWMMPMAQQYVKNYNPACKISRINVDQHDYEMFFHETWGENSVMAGISGQYQPANHPWLVSRHLGGRLPSGTGIINGVDKPHLFLKDGWIHGVFYDSVFDYYSTSNLAFEFFYISPELPELHVKQSHMIVNWWEENMPNIDAENIKKFVDEPHSGYYDNYNIACGRGPAFDINFQGQNGKNKYNRFGSHSHVVFQTLQRDAFNNKWNSFHNWTENYKWLRDKAPWAFELSETNGFKNTKSNKTKSIASKSYKLRRWPGSQHRIIV